MRINIISDLHLSQGAMPHPAGDADLVILAGDIARPQAAIEWAVGLGKPALYVAGNHEFYGSTIDGTRRQMQVLAAATPVRVLDDEAVIVDGVRFLGSTLWTDFAVTGAQAARDEAMRAAQAGLRDFAVIRGDANDGAAFAPADALRLFEGHARWLARQLATPHAGPTVVITHHAPSPRSIHPRFAGSPLNACFVSDLEHLLDGDRVQLWVHGHTHDSFDYCVNGTRVVCNPRGYMRAGQRENPAFDPEFNVEIG
ncbi:MAG: metallophosphoesterase [Casimicrobiaceae bacterium]